MKEIGKGNIAKMLKFNMPLDRRLEKVRANKYGEELIQVLVQRNTQQKPISMRDLYSSCSHIPVNDIDINISELRSMGVIDMKGDTDETIQITTMGKRYLEMN